MGQARKRLRLEVGLAILSVLLFVATPLWPEWIEIVFGVDPDYGNGSIEWLIMELTAISAVVAIFLARADWRRLRSGQAASSQIRARHSARTASRLPAWGPRPIAPRHDRARSGSRERRAPDRPARRAGCGTSTRR